MKTYYSLSADQLAQGARIPLMRLNESGEVFYELALAMIRTIEANNREGKPTVMILPVGPVGQYPIFVRLANQRRLDMRNLWIFSMDEYLDQDGQWIPESNPLSFRGFMNRNVYSRVDADLLPPVEQRIFPDPADPEAADLLMASLGGPDLCIGGIGLNGHLAFNEPQPELSIAAFSALGSRVRAIAPETRAANCMGDLKGALEDMPTHCVTLGIKQILSARKVVLGVFRDWHRGVLRRALHGEQTTAFPVTLLQSHPDALIISNATAAG